MATSPPCATSPSRCATGRRWRWWGATARARPRPCAPCAGLLPLRRGRIWLADERIDGLASWRVVGRGIAHVPEGRQLFPTMTVRENLELGAVASSAGRARQLDWVLALLPGSASGRTQITARCPEASSRCARSPRGLMARPRLLMLDEPSLGLAPVVVRDPSSRTWTASTARAPPCSSSSRTCPGRSRSPQRAYVLEERDGRPHRPLGRPPRQPAREAGLSGALGSDRALSGPGDRAGPPREEPGRPRPAEVHPPGRLGPVSAPGPSSAGGWRKRPVHVQADRTTMLREMSRRSSRSDRARLPPSRWPEPPAPAAGLPLRWVARHLTARSLFIALGIAAVVFVLLGGAVLYVSLSGLDTDRDAALNERLGLGRAAPSTRPSSSSLRKPIRSPTIRRCCPCCIPRRPRRHSSGARRRTRSSASGSPTWSSCSTPGGTP